MNFGKIGRFLKGEIPKASIPNRAFARLARLVRRQQAGMMDAGGLAYQADEYFPAKLRGSAGTGTSPYGFDEVQGTFGGWGIISSGRSGTNAYEYNSKAGLGGKVVRVYKEGEVHRFNYVRRNGCTGRIYVYVFGCRTGGFFYSPATGQYNSSSYIYPLTGATVTFTQGATVTNATYGTPVPGVYSIPITSADPGTLSVSKSRFATYTESLTPGCFTTTKNVFLGAATGYHCCPGPGCEPIPTILYLTDPAGVTVTLTRHDPGPGPFQLSPTFNPGEFMWTGGYSLTAGGYAPNGLGVCAPAYSVTGAIGYTLWCPNTIGPRPFMSNVPTGTGWALTQHQTDCDPPFGVGFGSGHVEPPGSWPPILADRVVSGFNQVGSRSVRIAATPPCVPLSLAGTFPGTVPQWAGPSGSFTITE